MSPEEHSLAAEGSATEPTVEVLRTATDIALESGFETLTPDTLAERLGWTGQELAQAVPDFRNLVELTITQAGDRAFKQVSQTQMPPLTPENARDRMVESISMYLAVVRSNPAVWRLVLLRPEAIPTALRERIEDGRLQVHDQMVEVISPILPDSVDPELTAWSLSALADNYARLVLLDPEGNAPSRLLEHAEVMVAGVLSQIRHETDLRE